MPDGAAGPPTTPVARFTPKVALARLGAQAALALEAYDGRLLHVSRNGAVLSKFQYLQRVHGAPVCPAALAAELLRHVSETPKPALPATEREVQQRLAREKGFRFYKFQREQQRTQQVGALREQQDAARMVLREQKRVGLFAQ